MKEEALKIAYKFLNDKNLKITAYAENEEEFIFQYKHKNKVVFDNCMVKVDKKTNVASCYIITEHFNELEKMKLKDVE